MGPSVFAGVGVMILMIPINAIIAAINRRLQVSFGKYSDWLDGKNYYYVHRSNRWSRKIVVFG